PLTTPASVTPSAVSKVTSQGPSPGKGSSGVAVGGGVVGAAACASGLTASVAAAGADTSPALAAGSVAGAKVGGDPAKPPQAASRSEINSSAGTSTECFIMRSGFPVIRILAQQALVSALPEGGLAGELGGLNVPKFGEQLDERRRQPVPPVSQDDLVQVVGGLPDPRPAQPELLGLNPVISLLPGAHRLIDTCVNLAEAVD